MNWPRWMLPSATPRPSNQVSVWSVAAGDARMFFGLAGALWLAALVQIVYKTVKAWPSAAPWPDAALAVLADLGTVGLGAAIVSMLLARAVNMMGGILLSLYQAMVNRFVLPVIEEHEARGLEKGLAMGREEGLAEGRAKGRTEGRAEGIDEGRTVGIEEGRYKAMAEWAAWNQRRLAAELAGQAFAEPPPSN